ncbi:hypothetical protein [Pseudoxanthomonas wuyuanensis]|nr:hypothetical protein [Pseudoxanthomonas wuyuanensis]
MTPVLPTFGTVPTLQGDKPKRFVAATAAAAVVRQRRLARRGSAIGF